MLILITYDVNTQDALGSRRLRKVAEICTRYGQRVQDSVFECWLDASQLVRFRHELLKCIDKERDSIRLYNLGNKYEGRAEHYGRTRGVDLTKVLMF